MPSPDVTPSHMSIGGWDTAKWAAPGHEIFWTQMTNEYFWANATYIFKVGDEVLFAPKEEGPKAINTIIDTGYSTLSFPQEYYDKTIEVLKT